MINVLAYLTSGSFLRRARTARWKIEVFLAAVFTVAAPMTALFPQWIEAFGFDPDRGDGSAEWTIVLAFATGAVATGLMSARDLVCHRRALSIRSQRDLLPPT